MCHRWLTRLIASTRLTSFLIATVAITTIAQSTLQVRAADPFSPRHKVVQAKATSSSEPIEIREFEVRVDNKTAGTHRLTIKSEGEKQEVGIQTDLRLDFVVYAYVFKFSGTEVWHEGRLLQSDIHVEDGGKKRAFSLKFDGDIQQISFNGKPVNGSTKGVMTTAYWQLPSHEIRSKPFPIVDVDSGKTHQATLTAVGPASLTHAGRALKCQHFKVDGPSPAELWFDEQGRLVRQQSVEVGHTVEIKLKQIRTAQNE
ncbi:DUF6134 family protein [Schlesneria paludicola]|uniref:DUF6134 family protein n=1 Tax=Schlesneria paludicola TaxID=360056 RepID=UPI00029A56B4|nr:DUF6134 family protein [Schlesneria paludicola]